MKKLIHLLLIILLSVTLNSCKKKQPPEPTLLEQLPERTESGEEKLVGIVNNEYIFNNNGIPWVHPDHGLHSWYTETSNGFLHIKGTYYNYYDNFNYHPEELFIEVFNIYGIGNYKIDDTLTSGIANIAYYKKKGAYYYIDSTHVGSLKVTKFDLENKIVAGTFNLKLINDETNETITITNGWFDIKY